MIHAECLYLKCNENLGKCLGLPRLVFGWADFHDGQSVIGLQSITLSGSNQLRF